MNEKNINHDEMPAELMDSLRREYKNDRTTAVEECPESANAIAYAFEELAPREHQKVEDHLQTCRPCMRLVLDARTADIESKEAAGQPVKMLPELSNAITRPEKPSITEKLAAGFRMPSMAAKILATAAVACIVVPITYFALKDPATDNPLLVVTKKVISAQNKKSKATTPSANDTQSELSSLNTFSSRDGWSTDPFEPLFNGKHGRTVSMKKRAKRVPRTPLEKLDLSQLKLVGVMLSDKGNTALVEDASGKGYVIKEGTYIGVNSGKVVQILKDRFIIEEEIEDVHGKIILRIREIRLIKP